MLIALIILGVLATFTVVPIDTTPLESSPHPIAEYAAAVVAYDSLQRAERGLVMTDGASLMFVHDQRTPRAIVLIHGLTNSPRQFLELGQEFYKRGYNVIIPRLPEHGLREGDIGSLKTLTAEKYRDYADRAIDVAVGLGDSVFVIGLSAGGNVAAWIAQHRPEVARVVVIAPAISLARVPNLLDPPLRNTLDRLPNITIHQKPDSGRPHAYFGTSTKGLGETLRFGATVMSADERPPSVHDVTFVVNASDRTVDQGPARHLAALWRERAGALTMVYEFDRALALPHDVIDVTQPCGMPELVYPVLIALLEKIPVEDAVSIAPRCGQK